MASKAVWAQLRATEIKKRREARLKAAEDLKDNQAKKAERRVADAERLKDFLRLGRDKSNGRSLYASTLSVKGPDGEEDAPL